VHFVRIGSQKAVLLSWEQIKSNKRVHRQPYDILEVKKGLTQPVQYRGADKSLARPGRKKATVTEDFDGHVSNI
jgi:hypothetical protein